MRVVIVTGLSGAGKSTALRALEDVGFYCVDNQPLPIIKELTALLGKLALDDVAVSVDARQFAFLAHYREHVAQLREEGHSVEVLFLEAPNAVLLRRFSETRRRHPLAGHDLSAAIARDRELLRQLRAEASIVDTGALNVHQLKGLIQERFSNRDGKLAVSLVSFGFKNGNPAEADLVFDVRYLPNPFFVEALSAKHGRDPEVADYVLQAEAGGLTLDRISEYLAFALPLFDKEGKLYLTVAIGCTGGRHRSVAMIEALAHRLEARWDVAVRHRDLEEEGGA